LRLSSVAFEKGKGEGTREGGRGGQIAFLSLSRQTRKEKKKKGERGEKSERKKERGEGGGSLQVLHFPRGFFGKGKVEKGGRRDAEPTFSFEV